MDKNKIQAILGLMTKNLECPICLDMLKNPISTRCDHQFCRFCISQVLKSKRSVPCPLCNKPITERSLQEREELAIIVKNVGDLINAFQEDSGDIFTPPKGPLLQHFSPSTPEPLVARHNIRYAKHTGKKQKLNTCKNSKSTGIEKEEESQDDFQSENVLPRTMRSSKLRSSKKNSAKTTNPETTKAENTSVNSTGNCSSSSSSVTNNKEQHHRSTLHNIKTYEAVTHVTTTDKYSDEIQGQCKETENIHSVKTTLNSVHHDVLNLDTTHRPTVRWAKKKNINVTKNDELLDCLNDASLGATKNNIRHAEAKNIGVENTEESVSEIIKISNIETVGQNINQSSTSSSQDEKCKEQTHSSPTSEHIESKKEQHITSPNMVELPAIVYSENLTNPDPKQQPLNCTQESFVVNFYDSQSKDPNKIKAIVKKPEPKRRMSKRLQKIHSSPVTSALSQCSVKAPLIVTKTYGKRQHISRAVKDKNAKDWKKVLADPEQKENPFVCNDKDNETKLGSATSSQGSAFGFKSLDKEELMDSASKSQITVPQIEATDIEESCKETIDGKHTSDTINQSVRSPDAEGGIKDITNIPDVLPENDKKLNNDLLKHSLDSPKNRELKNTLDETPLKYGRGKKMTDSVDNSIMMNSKPVQGYLPKTSSRHRTLKVAIKAGKGKIEMSLENQISSDETLGKKPLVVNKSLNMANIHAPQDFGEKMVDPYEFRSSQTPKGRKKKKARKCRTTKSSKIKSLELTSTKETKPRKGKIVSFADEKNSNASLIEHNENTCTEKVVEEYDPVIPSLKELDPTLFEEELSDFIQPEGSERKGATTSFNSNDKQGNVDMGKSSKNAPKGRLKNRCKNDENDTQIAEQMKKLIEKISIAEDHDIISSTQEAYSSMEKDEKVIFEEAKQNNISISANVSCTKLENESILINDSDEEDDHCLIHRSADDSMLESTQVNVIEVICPPLETIDENYVNSTKSKIITQDIATPEKQNSTKWNNINEPSRIEVSDISVNCEVAMPVSQTKITPKSQNTHFVKHGDSVPSGKPIPLAEIMKDTEIEIRKPLNEEDVVCSESIDHSLSSVVCIPICIAELFSVHSSPSQNNNQTEGRAPTQHGNLLQNHIKPKANVERNHMDIESNSNNNETVVTEKQGLRAEKKDRDFDEVTDVIVVDVIDNSVPLSKTISRKLQICDIENDNHQPLNQTGKQCNDGQTSQQDDSMNQETGEDVIPETNESHLESQPSGKSKASRRKTPSIFNLMNEKKDMNVTVIANSIESQASESASYHHTAGSVTKNYSPVEIKEPLVDSINISSENNLGLKERSTQKVCKTMKEDSEKDLIKKSVDVGVQDKESSGTDDLNISVDESQYELVDSGSQNRNQKVKKITRKKVKKHVENINKQLVQNKDMGSENKDDTTQSTIQASLDSQYKLHKGMREESSLPGIVEASKQEYTQDGENEAEVYKMSQTLKASSEVSESLLNNPCLSVSFMNSPNSSQPIKKITPDSRKRLFARRSNSALQKPASPLTERSVVDNKNSNNVPENDMESSEDSTSVKRKSSFSSYDNKKSRLSGNSASTRNSCESGGQLLSQEACVNQLLPEDNFPLSARPSTVNNTSVNLDESSDDEELVIHRPKRKCFSLDGSPINPNKFSQKSSGDSVSSKNPIAKGESKNNVCNTMSQTNSQSTTKHLINFKHQANECRLEPSVDQNNLLGLNEEHRSDEKDSNTNKSNINTSQGKNNIPDVSNKSQEPNDLITIAESEEDPVILISPNIEPTTTENAETMPPSGLPPDFQAEDDDSMESALHLPDNLQLCDSDEEEITDSIDVGKSKGKNTEKSCKADEESDDESVQSVKEALPITTGDEFVNTLDEMDDKRFGNLPRTSSPIMGTGGSVNINAIDIEDDDEEEDIVRKRGKKMSAIIESDDEDEASAAGESSTHLNSSSAFSSQCELTTQQKGDIVSDIEKMKREIAVLEAEIAGKTKPGLSVNDGGDDEIVEEDEEEFVSLPDLDTEKNVIAPSDDIENPASDNSQSELFLSPLRFSPPPSSPLPLSPTKTLNDKLSPVQSPHRNSPDFLTNPDKEDSCEEEMDVDRIAETPEPELPEEVLRAMEILTKYKTQLQKQNSPRSSELSAKSTPLSKRQDHSKSASPLVTNGTQNRVECSLENIENTLKEITPNRNNARLTSCESTPLRRVHKHSSIETTPILKSRDSPVNSNSVSREKSGRTMRNMSKSEKCNFAATGLSAEQLINVQKLAALNGGRFYPKFNQHVTHLIVKPVSAGSRVCERTLKFFQGIANKCWILVYDWIEESLKSEYLVSEEWYEVTGDTVTGENHNGPMQSRLAKQPLFTDLSVTCIGDSAEMSKESMINLLTTCGAIYVKDVETLALSNAERSLIICCSDTQDSTPSSEDIAKFKSCYKYYELITVSREWVLDSIGMFQLGPLKDYLLTPGRVTLPI